MIIETWYKRRQKTICSFEICLTFIIGIFDIGLGISSNWFVCNNEKCFLNLRYRFSSFVYIVMNASCILLYMCTQHTTKCFFLFIFAFKNEHFFGIVLLIIRFNPLFHWIHKKDRKNEDCSNKFFENKSLCN